MNSCQSPMVLASQPDAPSATLADPSTKPTLPAKSVVVVEDDPNLLDLWFGTLTGAGYDVAAFSSFRSAKHYLAEHRLDALLTDIRLGAFNGLQLVMLAKALNPGAVMAVITGFDDPVLRREAAKHGADYLTKPIGCEQVLAFLRSGLGSRSPAVA